MKTKKITLFAMAFSLLLGASCKETPKQEETKPTNQTLETILKRKSVREFTNKEISAEDMNNLLKAGMAAPSAMDKRPWHFIVVSDKATLQKLGEELKNAAALKNADKAIIVCGDSIISEKFWDIDCSAATQNILLAAESMGIGAFWAALYPYADRNSIVYTTYQLPGNLIPLAIIPLGYPAKEVQPKDKYDATRIHENKW